MLVATIVGARPQFIKAAVVSRAISRVSATIKEVMLHSGQHYDAAMSEIFFNELEIPAPAHNLGIGGGTHGQNTGRMIVGIEHILNELRPDVALIYGDTDSTLAGAIAATKIGIPVAHVEAGLRSGNRRMPEEINRILSDHASELLFAPTAAAVANLRREGIGESKVHWVGDVMFDAALHFAERAEQESNVLSRLRLESGRYILATIHRKENTDDAARLQGILEGLTGAPVPVVWPMHPRTRARLGAAVANLPSNFRVIEPVGYLDMVQLERAAMLIATDSGGVQKEAFFHRTPCIVLRDETEWVELVDLGANVLVGTDAERIAIEINKPPRTVPAASFYGQGTAGEQIVEVLQARLGG